MAMRRSTKMQLAKMAREESRVPQLSGRKMEFEYERWDEPRQNYGGEMRMNYAPESRGNSGGDRSGGNRGGSGGRMEYGGARSGYGMEPGMGGYDAKSRFRDRRGREHYDNGRFAPMRSDYFPNGPYMEHDHPFGPDQRGGDDMRQIGFNANWGGEMRMGSDASIPRYNEMERMPGNRAMMGGYMAGHEEYPKMDERTAMEWVKSMHNEDGTKSPHWTMDQVKQVIKQKGVDLEPAEFFAIMNAIYSDFDPVLKKHGVSNMEMYVDMAKAWLKDKDAVPNKATAYYECIVKK